MVIPKLIAYCGLVCVGCPIYWATREKDREQKAKIKDYVVRQCQEHYDLTLRPADITDCDGCRNKTGRLYSGCRDCEIRACAQQKKLESCALCPEYACEKLLHFFTSDPSAKTRLEMIRDILLI